MLGPYWARPVRLVCIVAGALWSASRVTELCGAGLPLGLELVA